MQIFQKEPGMSFMTVINVSNYILQQSQFIQHLLYWTTGILCAWWQATSVAPLVINFFTSVTLLEHAIECAIFMSPFSAILPKAWWLLFCNSWKSSSTLLEFAIGLLWQLQDVQHRQDEDRTKLELLPFLATVFFFQLRCHQCCISMTS